MRRKNLVFLHILTMIALVLGATCAVADPNVKIISPADGFSIGAGESLDVVYEIIPNPGGDHSHIYVNNKEAGILRKQKGKYTLDALPSGSNSICLKVVNKAHASIGQETCIKVTHK